MPSSQGERQASSGTTVADEHVHVVHGENRYVAPKTQCSSSSHANNSQLSQDSASTTGDEALLLGEHMSEVISVISKLEGLGLQRLQIPLPKCVVLGMHFLSFP